MLLRWLAPSDLQCVQKLNAQKASSHSKSYFLPVILHAVFSLQTELITMGNFGFDFKINRY